VSILITTKTRPLCSWRPALVAVPLMVLSAPGVGAGLVDEFLAAADRGQCIESLTYQMIRDQGPDDASPVVSAALAAHAQRKQQQMTLGCDGDIAAQAIAAGADPQQVLRATAAGL